MISVRAANLGKAYRTYRRPLDSFKELLLGRDYADTFWALRDVTLEVPQGGSLGIIGDNGAGKSTLLKLLAGAIAPSVGQVEHVGRVAAILTLDTGFHPDLSGAENIRIGCAVLGLSPSETAAIFREIVEFSELGAFVDRPVRTYSSGMYLRLAFSVATAVRPDLLVVDEYLSVGDQHFRHKCMRRILELRREGCALVFCSHDMHAIGEVCERVLWLREGQPAMLASAQQVLLAYQDHVRARDAGSDASANGQQQPPRQRPADNYLREVTLGGACRDGQITTGETITLRVVARLTNAAWREGAHVGVLITRNDAVWCYGVSTKMDGLVQALHPVGGDDYGVVFAIDNLPLLAGQYSWTVALMDERTPHVYEHWTGVCPFSVRPAGQDVGVARIAHRWERPGVSPAHPSTE